MIAPEFGRRGFRHGAASLRLVGPPSIGCPVLGDPEVEAWVRSALMDAAPHLESAGITLPRLEGRLLRPSVAFRFIRPEDRESLPMAFWFGCWAIQMVHEASLLHDDVLDDGKTRRGRPTLLAQAGRAASLIRGDEYLTGAYVVANRVGRPRFMSRFVRAVQDTVRGEILQADSPSGASWRDVLPLKTGALFGISASLASEWSGILDACVSYDLGSELGVLYQRVDDLLDYCPGAETGKPPLQDFRRGLPTWIVPDPALDWFHQSDRQLLATLFGGAHRSLAQSLLDRLEHDVERWVNGIEQWGVDEGLARLPRRWLDRCRHVVELEESRLGANSARSGGVFRPSASRVRTQVEEQARGIGGPGEWPGIFSRGSRSFSFAARLFPPEARARITGIYAFCRFTDDLVDEADGVVSKDLDVALDHWSHLCRRAYGGERTDIPLLDVVIGNMGREGIPLDYPLELIEGMRMDIRPPVYRDLDHLRLYTYRVASVVGGWMVQCFGIADPWTLDRAFSLGHAMQLTNILRDVGEDLDAGRVYLPTDLMLRHGLTSRDLVAMRQGGWIDPAYPGLLEEIMAAADESYEAAFEGLACVPGFFARPVAAAARIYQGIHGRIRANGYDNLTRRAHTSFWGKVRHAGDGLRILRSQRGRRASLGFMVSGAATRTP
ncbi:MAG: squalene/phytoene synthase family protein [Gemmatimonadetes bacterium]|nr:squalene/phytoene synthase family protein [Gemmatimonadota bacterium]